MKSTVDKKSEWGNSNWTVIEHDPMKTGLLVSRLHGLSNMENVLSDDIKFGSYKPERWYVNPTWRCYSDHVSKHYIGSAPYAKCPVCGKAVYLTFPEDIDGPLIKPVLYGKLISLSLDS